MLNHTVELQVKAIRICVIACSLAMLLLCSSISMAQNSQKGNPSETSNKANARVYDKQGNYQGEARDGRVYDKYGNYQGDNREGRAYDRYGNYQGKAQGDRIYDKYGNYQGSVSQDGSVYGKSGKYQGKIQKQ